MPLEVRELIVKVNVGSPPPPTPRVPDRLEFAALRRELVKACLAELRQLLAERNDR
ncbi:MAG TPA: DUF5908 family protein [Candidatus Didemnitutus sp.]|nr:DUF5908 family protein [Candidatus Didemnitutus sp.]